MKKINYLSFIKTLLSFSPRQLEVEKKTVDFLISFLKNHQSKYWPDYFFTKIPKIEKVFLKADGKEIPCQGCSFVSGKIKDKNYLISSLIPSRFFIDKSNINFNPQCPEISLSNFYFAPALAISRQKLPLILRAKRIEGEIRARKVKHRTVNILVGNRENPKIICFAHYDSILRGAVDNASGVAVMMATILEQPELLKKNLFVFSANEELSYDYPTYWGHGFRVFEKKYFSILKKSKKIIVLDCLGYSPPQIYRDENSLYLAFPIINREKWKKKIVVLAGEIEGLMIVYHSEADNLGKLRLRYLKEAQEKFLTFLK